MAPKRTSRSSTSASACSASWVTALPCRGTKIRGWASVPSGGRSAVGFSALAPRGGGGARLRRRLALDEQLGPAAALDGDYAIGDGEFVLRDFQVLVGALHERLPHRAGAGRAEV